MPCPSCGPVRIAGATPQTESSKNFMLVLVASLLGGAALLALLKKGKKKAR